MVSGPDRDAPPRCTTTSSPFRLSCAIIIIHVVCRGAGSEEPAAKKAEVTDEAAGVTDETAEVTDETAGGAAAAAEPAAAEKAEKRAADAAPGDATEQPKKKRGRPKGAPLTRRSGKFKFIN